MRNVQRDQNDRLRDAAREDEVRIAGELQAAGMTRGDALRTAAAHVADRLRRGLPVGGIVEIKRPPGSNGGPVITD